MPRPTSRGFEMFYIGQMLRESLPDTLCESSSSKFMKVPCDFLPLKTARLRHFSPWLSKNGRRAYRENSSRFRRTVVLNNKEDRRCCGGARSQRARYRESELYGNRPRTARDSQISRNVLHLIRQQCVVARVNYIGHETPVKTNGSNRR